MFITRLSKEAVDELGKAFKKEKNGRQKTRYQAIWLLSKGWKKVEVADVVGMSKDRIRQLVTLYHKDGLNGLKIKPAPGNHRLLSKQQKLHIKKLITAHTPAQLGLTGNFWNTLLLRELVKIKFNLSYQDQDSYRRLLIWCGFSFHKPAKVNQRQNEHMKVRFEETLKKDSRTGLTEKIRWSW
jgi:transposase